MGEREAGAFFSAAALELQSPVASCTLARQGWRAAQ
jgi:hypothetical protein